MHSKTFIDDVQALIVLKQDGTAKKRLVNEICAKYNIAQETLYHRIRSYYGKPLQEVRWDHFEPTRGDLLQVVARASAPADVRRYYADMPNRQFVGLYDRVLGVSTFHKARLLTLDESSEVSPRKYAPSVKDNEALIAASRLGDANFANRNGRVSLRIEHGPKQREWLAAKVSMFRQSFPWMYSQIRETPRETWVWYGGTFPDGKYADLAKRPKPEMVGHLTPFGIWVLFLDDGCYVRGKSPSITFAVENRDIGDRLARLLETFGYSFTVENEHAVSLKQQYYIKKFLMEFCEPFEHLTPDCMRYKTVFE